MAKSHKVKHYITARHHAQAAGVTSTADRLDDDGNDRFPALAPGDTVSKQVYDALYPEDAEDLEPAAPPQS